MKPNELPNPIRIGSLSVQAVVQVPQSFAHLVQKMLGLQGRMAGMNGDFVADTVAVYKYIF